MGTVVYFILLNCNNFCCDSYNKKHVIMMSSPLHAELVWVKQDIRTKLQTVNNYLTMENFCEGISH